MNDIREMFPGVKSRWTNDHQPKGRFDPYHVELVGKFGTVFLHGTAGGIRLQAHVEGRLQAPKLLRIPGVKVHQVGDLEASVVFTPDLAPAVFKVVGIRKKRKSAGNPEALKRHRQERTAGA